MTENTPLAPETMRRLFWFSQISSVMLMTALAWFLPEFIAPELIVIEQNSLIQMILLISGAVAVPIILLVNRRLMPTVPPVETRYDPLADTRTTPDSPGLGLYLVALALCEIPIICGLIAVFMGARPEYALGLGAMAGVLLWLQRPS